MKKTLTIVTITFLALILMVSNRTFSQGQWTILNSGTSSYLPSINFPTPDTGYVGTVSGKILKTTNGGSNWSAVATLPIEPFSMSFKSKDIGVAAGETIWKTIDGGTNWTMIFPDSGYVFMYVKMLANDTLIAVCLDNNTNDGKAFKSIDGGSNWLKIGQFSGASTMAAFFINSKNGFFGDANGNIYKTSNSGSSWTAYQTGYLLDLSSIFFSDINHGCAVGSWSGNILITNNGGLSWNLVNGNSAEPLYSVFFTSTDTGYAVGGNGMNIGDLEKTYDGGLTWTQATTSIQTIVCVHFPNKNTGYASGTGGAILKYSITVGTNEFQNPLNFSFYPNPASNNITIKDTPKSEIEILNLQAQIIKRIKTTENKTTIDISDFARGMYFIKVTTEKGVMTKKFIKE